MFGASNNKAQSNKDTHTHMATSILHCQAAAVLREHHKILDIDLLHKQLLPSQ